MATKKTDLGGNLGEVEKTARLTLETERLSLELQKLRGELIPRREALETFATVIKTAASRLLGVPSALAFQLAAESDPAVCESLLRDAIETVLRELADHAIHSNSNL